MQPLTPTLVIAVRQYLERGLTRSHEARGARLLRGTREGDRGEGQPRAVGPLTPPQRGLFRVLDYQHIPHQLLHQQTGFVQGIRGGSKRRENKKSNR